MSNFHPLGGLSVQEKEAQNARVFTGDGTPYLKVPGLKSLEGVRVGSCVIPLSIEQEFPADPQGKRLETETVPLLDVQTDDAGQRILLRGIQSNDGIWQAGATIVVTGEWDDAKGAATK